MAAGIVNYMLPLDELPPTVAEVLAERQDMFVVNVRRNEFGTFDVVLRIDGSYTIPGWAEDAADYWAAELGVPRTERHGERPA